MVSGSFVLLTYQIELGVVGAVRFPEWLRGLLILLIVIGVVFRFVNLNHKVYWHDEVYTTMRAAGYTRGEIDQELFQNRQIPGIELQRYQQIKPGSTAAHTIQSLAIEDPQHPPLYFLMTRYWMQWLGKGMTRLFNSPLTVMRSLPALLSLLALPAMYGLAWELFTSHAVSLLATALMAISPFDVLFAQTARQYSLLTVMVILSSYLLLRAIRLFQAAASQSATAQRHAARSPLTWLNWGLYAISVAIGLYTQPFFLLTIISHIAYVVACFYWEPHFSKQRETVFKFFAGSLAIAVLLFSPWLVVIVINVQRAIATTDWTHTAPGIDYLLKLWLLSFTALFIDFDFGFDNPWTFIARIPFLGLIMLSLYAVCRRTPPATWLFILLSILVPFGLLAIPDSILGGKRSATSRYLIACFPAVQLAVAYFLTTQLSLKRVYSGRSPVLSHTYTPYTLRPAPYTVCKTWVWRGTLAIIMVTSLASLTASALSNSWWNRDVSYYNDQTADILNKTASPIVISDIGDDYTNTGDLISLSYRLDNKVELLLVQSPDFVETKEFQTLLKGKTAIAFRPSKPLHQTLEQTFGQMQRILPGERLWKIEIAPNNNSNRNEKNKKKD